MPCRFNSFLIALFTFSSLTTFGVTNIQIAAQGSYIGKSVYLYTIADAFSNRQEMVGNSTISSDGFASLDVNTDKIIQVQLCIDRVISYFYLEPNTKYNITFPAIPKTMAKSFNRTNEVSVLFNNLNNKDVNYLITDFNNRFDLFFDKNIATIFDKEFKVVLNKFKLECDLLYNGYNNEFLNQYIQFSFGNLELNTGTTRKVLFEKYLSQKEFNVQNKEFANFIAKFFGDYANKYDIYIKGQPLSSALTKGNTTEFLEVLKRDDFLKDRSQLLDLAAASILAKDYQENPARRKSVLKILTEIAQTAARPQTKEICANINLTLTQFKPGSPVFPFQLETTTNKRINLTTLLGKPTYLIFAASWSKESTAELRLLNSYYEKYRQKVNFILISVDSTANELELLLSATGNKIHDVCFIPADDILLEKLNILYIPQFVLIDAKGNYFKWFALEPTRGLENDLIEVLN